MPKKAFAHLLRIVGGAWIAVVLGYTLWIGLLDMLDDTNHIGGMYIAAIEAAPGAGLVWLGSRLLQKPGDA